MFWLELLKTGMQLVLKFFAVREREQFIELGQHRVREEIRNATKSQEETWDGIEQDKKYNDPAYVLDRLRNRD